MLFAGCEPTRLSIDPQPLSIINNLYPGDTAEIITKSNPHFAYTVIVERVTDDAIEFSVGDDEQRFYFDDIASLVKLEQRRDSRTTAPAFDPVGPYITTEQKQVSAGLSVSLVVGQHPSSHVLDGFYIAHKDDCSLYEREAFQRMHNKLESQWDKKPVLCSATFLVGLSLFALGPGGAGIHVHHSLVMNALLLEAASTARGNPPASPVLHPPWHRQR